MVREDLSIPGAVEAQASVAADSANSEAQFFNVLRDSKPDVILLDATSGRGDGVAAIGKVRASAARSRSWSSARATISECAPIA